MEKLLAQGMMSQTLGGGGGHHMASFNNDDILKCKDLDQTILKYLVSILLDKDGRVTQTGNEISKKLGFNAKDLEDKQFDDTDIQNHLKNLKKIQQNKQHLIDNVRSVSRGKRSISNGSPSPTKTRGKSNADINTSNNDFENSVN